MLILMTGMQRSGSTLHFNMVQALLTEAGIPFDAAFVSSFDDVASARADIGEALVFKLHFFDERLAGLLRDDSVFAFYIYRNTLDMAASWLRKTDGSFTNNLADIKAAIAVKYAYFGLPGVMVSAYEDVIASNEMEMMKLANVLGLDISPRRLVELAERVSPGRQRARLAEAQFEKRPIPAGSSWSMRQGDEEGDDYVLVDGSSLLHQGHFTSNGDIGGWADALAPTEAAELVAIETEIAVAAHEQRLARALSTINEKQALIGEMGAMINHLTGRSKELEAALESMAAELEQARKWLKGKELDLNNAETKLERLQSEFDLATRTFDAERASADAALEREREVGRLAQLETRRLAGELATSKELVDARAATIDRLAEQVAVIPRFETMLDEAEASAVGEREAFRNVVISLHAWRESLATRRGGRALARALPAPKIPAKLSPTPRARRKDFAGRDNLKISIITPCYNSADDLERAIKSVLIQDYENWEHIVVDGGSTDGTCEILSSFDHLIWISEPDRGQVHAMNKGFAMATGDVVSYLNADDYYKPSAFQHVIDAFEDPSACVVYGDVEVYDPANDSRWLNTPRYDFRSVLRHWEPNAFCVNPVGYFYRREVQEAVPFLESDGAKHDLAFLMDVAWRYEDRSVKIDRPLGVFVNAPDTQTARQQSVEAYWSPENFGFLERFLTRCTDDERAAFRMVQKAGYEQRKRWVREANAAREMAEA